MQKPRLRRHRDERARIGEQHRLAQLAVPGAEAEPSAFVGGELEPVAAHKGDDGGGVGRFRARVAASPIARTAIQAA